VDLGSKLLVAGGKEEELGVHINSFALTTSPLPFVRAIDEFTFVTKLGKFEIS